jgi:hypothetical protein
VKAPGQEDDCVEKQSLIMFVRKFQHLASLLVFLTVDDCVCSLAIKRRAWVGDVLSWRYTLFGGIVKGRVGKDSTSTYSLTRCGVWVVSILNEQYDAQRSTQLVILAHPRSYIWPQSQHMQPDEAGAEGLATISADSGPEMLNSRSAYFFQYPKRRGNLRRNRS